MTGSASAEELERLQRLALVSGESAPPESLVEVMEEIEAWLGEQTPNSVGDFRGFSWCTHGRFWYGRTSRCVPRGMLCAGSRS